MDDYKVAEGDTADSALLLVQLGRKGVLCVDLCCFIINIGLNCMDLTGVYSVSLHECSTIYCYLNRKLRRGDKFTDLQFLSSPIFKQKPDRRSVTKSRNSVSSQKPFEKYNESFVGCR